MEVTWDSLLFLLVIVTTLGGLLYGLFSTAGSEISKHSGTDAQTYGDAEVMNNFRRGTR
jgi:hypothetical protein